MRVALYLPFIILVSGCISQGAVLVTLDGERYDANSPVRITIENGTDEAIFFGGCNDYVIQKKAGADWQIVGQKVCVWEGIPRRLKSGESITIIATIEEEGLFRVLFDYGVGCGEGKPMSQAGCASTHTVFKEFRVGAAWDIASL